MSSSGSEPRPEGVDDALAPSFLGPADAEVVKQETPHHGVCGEARVEIGKIERGDPAMRIGAPGPMGRILVRGEPGHDIIPKLYPIAGEPVIDKPGKGAFYQTDLELMLHNLAIDTLLVCCVPTEVCVNESVREDNDVGFRCIVLADCCASYFPEFHDMGLKMIKAQGGIFGSVSSSAPVVAALAPS